MIILGFVGVLAVVERTYDPLSPDTSLVWITLRNVMWRAVFVAKPATNTRPPKNMKSYFDTYVKNEFVSFGGQR